MLVLLLSAAAWAVPACLVRPTPDTATSAVVHAARVPEDELLARLAYAEGTSTGFPEDPLVFRAIAWGVMNRVRLAAASPSAAAQYGQGVDGVVFKAGQFNPAVSKKSRFGQDFLCPTDEARWTLATAGAKEALAGVGNPFVATDWEEAHGLSLVVNFYYPASVQAKTPLAPWEGNGLLDFVGDVVFAAPSAGTTSAGTTSAGTTSAGTTSPGTTSAGEKLLASEVRFYRLTSPPADVAAR